MAVGALLLAVGLTAQPASAQDADTPADDDALLAQGAEVYTTNCSGCHQPGGVGLPPQFPPLLGNPHVQDTEYVLGVLANGREGELVVNDVTYDGRMPAFSTLPDDEALAVIAYVQSGFAAPAGAAAASAAAPDGAGLPPGADLAMQVAFILAAGVALFILLPRITSTHDGLTMPWLDAGLKTAIIVAGFVVLTVFVPNWALQTDTVQALDRRVQDFVGTTLWVGGLGVTLLAVWYAHREKRI